MSEFSDVDLKIISEILIHSQYYNDPIARRISKMANCDHEFVYGYGHFDPTYCCKCGRERT